MLKNFLVSFCAALTLLTSTPILVAKQNNEYEETGRSYMRSPIVAIAGIVCLIAEVNFAILACNTFPRSTYAILFTQDRWKATAWKDWFVTSAFSGLVFAAIPYTYRMVNKNLEIVYESRKQEE